MEVKKSLTRFFSMNLKGKDAAKEIARWEEKSSQDDYSIVGIRRAAELILQHKDLPVHIAGDYDVDGKCASAILYRTLKKLEFKDVRIHIPKRFTDGYGLNERILSECIGGGLLVTVDNGIAACDLVKKAKTSGLDVIVTDHHLPMLDETGNVLLPEAAVVIDPNAIQGSADFSGYCGAGLAYKLSLFLLDKEGDTDAGFRNQLLTIAALATVCDMVPMIEENHVFVKHGLVLLERKETFPGILALMESFSLSETVTEQDLGYKLGPCINADTRLDEDSTVALDLLLEDDIMKAAGLAARLKEKNEERKALCEKAEADAEKVIKHYHMEENFPLILNLGKVCREGLIGILAGKLAEKYAVPTIVFAETESGLLKGSARSYGGIDIHQQISSAKDLLQTFGGHASACGLSVLKKDYFDMRKRITDSAEMTCSRPARLGKSFDIEVTEEEIPEVIEELKAFQPFGEDFERPVFKVSEFTCLPKDGLYFKALKKEGVKLEGKVSSAVGFGFQQMLEGKRPKDISLIGDIQQNCWNGRSSVQIMFSDLEIRSEYITKTLSSVS